MILDSQEKLIEAYEHWFQDMSDKALLGYIDNIELFLEWDSCTDFLLIDEVLCLYQVMLLECVNRIRKRVVIDSEIGCL